MLRLRRSEKFADVVTSRLSEALGFSEEGPFEYELDICRAFAFSATSADEFAEWYLRSECLSKYSGAELPTAEAAAIASLMEGEESCRLFNRRLLRGEYSERTKAVLIRACGLIQKVIGEVTLEEVFLGCDFGPGSSAAVARRYSSYHEKWDPSQGTQHFATLGAIPYLALFQRKVARDLAIPSRFTICPGNTVTTVAKNWKTRRTIAREPLWNMFLQKGVGALIRRRLQRVGMLHADAQYRQRVRAKKGSVDGSLATVDLRNASNSISVQLVNSLIEGPLHRMIFDLRSPAMWSGYEGAKSDPSKWNARPYEMISSMGNGYTFELETLLFWSLTAAVCGRKGHHWSTTTVYGDDIICPSDCVEELGEVFAELGLTMNDKKSFRDGPFRESCGGHYWNGVDVTPFYLRKPPVTNGQLIDLHNRIYTWCNTRGWFSFHEYTDVIRACRRETPRELRGPVGLPGCLWSEWDECAPEWDRSTQSYAQCIVRRKEKKHQIGTEPGALLNRLWSSHEGHDGCFSPLREAGDIFREALKASQRLTSFLHDPSLQGADFTQKSEVQQREEVVRVRVDRNMWSIPSVSDSLL